MRDGSKTKEQLVDELMRLRRQNADLEASEAELKGLAEALQLSARQWQAALNAIGDSVCLLDMEGRVLQCNKAAEDLLGKPSGEVIGHHCWEVMHGTSEPIEGCPIVRMQETRQRESLKLPIDDRWIEITVDPMLDEAGNIIGAVHILSDITERKRAEEALADEREHLAVTLMSIGDGVIATDTEGRIVLINKTAETLTGWTAEEAVGRLLREVFHIIDEDTRSRAAECSREPCGDPVEEALKTDGMVSLAERNILIARDGTERIIADSGSPIRDRDGNTIGVVLVFRDITETRRMEKELLRAQKHESLGVLAGGIAHNFNNILTLILGNISLARMYTDPEKVSERLIEAERACMRAKGLTNQLLTFSSGGAPIKKTTSIAELLEDSAIFALSGSNVRCEFSIPDDLWPVELDEGQMGQVISNIVINADQAMPRGGVIHVRAENVTVGTVGAKPRLTPGNAGLEGRRPLEPRGFEWHEAPSASAPAEDALPLKEGDYVKISIEDKGVGIPEEYLKRIFDPYFTTKQRGSGLGLATSYSIIKNHGGFITAESRVGVGTTFHVYLPASPGEVVIEREEMKGEPIIGECRILVMDDEESIRNLVDEILSRIGYKVTTAIDGEETVELYQEAKAAGEPYAAVIVDLTIPGGMGGQEAIQKLMEIDPDVKAIVSSGYSSDPIMAKFKEHGFRGIITKPYKAKELSEVLREVIMGIDGR